MLKPLSGKKIVITRGENDSRLSADYFLDSGAEVILFPVICAKPREDMSEFDKIVRSDPDYIIFTSGNAVGIFMDRIKLLNYSPDYSKTVIASVGRKTYDKCAQFGITAGICPAEFSAAGLLAEFEKYEVKNKTVLIPSSVLAGDELGAGLEARGAKVYRINIYDITLPPENIIHEGREMLKAVKADIYIFASPSAYKNFLKIMDIDAPSAYFLNTCVAAIGPVTKNFINNSGVEVALVPQEYTMKALSEEIVKYFSR